MFKWGLFGSQDVARANLRAASWCPRPTSSQSPLSAARRPRARHRPSGQVSAPMKAFFHRLHIGSGPKDKDRDPPTVPKEKFPPLPSWPPQSDSPRPTSTSTIPASFKPLPELVHPSFPRSYRDPCPPSSLPRLPPKAMPVLSRAFQLPRQRQYPFKQRRARKNRLQTRPNRFLATHAK